MIARVWAGWTQHVHADAFEHAVLTVHYPALFGKPIAGFRRSELLRLTRPGQTEFRNVIWFDSMDDVRNFAGPDVDKPLLLPPATQALLRRFDTRVEHFEVRGTWDELQGFSRHS